MMTFPMRGSVLFVETPDPARPYGTDLVLLLKNLFC